MRFIDANVFIYGVLKAKKAHTKEAVESKRKAKAILSRIDEGEPVATSVVHISEVANVLEDHMPLQALKDFLASILYKDSIVIYGIDREIYREANESFVQAKIGINDAIAVTLMRREGIREIYSFDSHFQELEAITRITE